MKSYRMGPESRAAVEAARAQGLNLPEKPSEEMRDAMPKDLTELDDVTLMGMYTEIIGWSDYLAVQHSFAQTDERRIKRKLEFLEAKALIQAKSVASKVTDARPLVKDDRRSRTSTKRLRAPRYRSSSSRSTTTHETRRCYPEN